MQKTITPLRADLIMLIVALLWGSSYVVTKDVVDNVDPMKIIFYRFFIASVLNLIFYGRKLKNVSKGELKSGVLVGTVLTLGLFFSVWGVKYTTVSKNAFIVSISVVMVPFVYWIICKKKPTSVNILAVILMTVGLAFLILDFSGNITVNRGDIITMGCLLFFSFHVVLCDMYAKQYRFLVVNMLSMMSAALISFVYLLIRRDLSIDFYAGSLNSIIYLGVFPTFLSYNVQMFAQRYTTATHASIILSLESAFGSILAIVFLDETLTLNMIIGCIIIFLSVITSEIGDSVLKKIKHTYLLKIQNINSLKK